MRRGLLEVTPGTGWLAREHDRIVWVPAPIDIDQAHRCIEPLLTADTFDDAADYLAANPPTGIPLVFLTIDAPTQVVTHGFSAEHLHSHIQLIRNPLRGLPLDVLRTTLPRSRFVQVPLGIEPASGMLVEGVVRAGAWKWSFAEQRSVRRPEPDDHWELFSDSGLWHVGDDLVIGRGTERQDHPTQFIALDDPAVSRTHALVIRDHSGLRIIDSRSKNGTWIVRGDDDLAVVHWRTSAALADGDAIVVGETALRVRRHNQ